MDKCFISLLTILCLTACDTTENISQSQQPTEVKTSMAQAKPPIAPKRPKQLTIHNDTRIDNYYWMRDDDRKDTEIINHLEAENQYLEQSLAHTEDLQQKIFDELKSRIKKDDQSVPLKIRGYYYFRRFEGEKEYPVYVRQKGSLTAKEEILLDGNAMAEGHDYFNIGDYEVSTNNEILAYSTDTISRRIYTIEFKSLPNNEMLTDKLEQTTGEIVWANDNKHVFYIKKDPQTLLGNQVYRHELGTPQEKDVLVYQENDLSFYTSLGKTKDDSTILINHGSTLVEGVSILNADQPTGEFKKFAPLEDNHEYSVEKLGDWFYVYTNWQATNFRLMKVKAEDSQDKSKWLEVIAHDPEVFLEDIELFKDYLVVSQKVRGQTQLKAIHWESQKEQLIEFDDSVYVAGFTGNVTNDTDKVRLYYSSLTTPMTTYDYNLSSGKRDLLKQQEVLGDFHPKNYHGERIFVKARDGAEVPVSIVYRKDKFKQDGSNPLYQYGYGSYGYTVEPTFSSARLSLLDRGFVFAIAHIRGGQMLGREWYDNGKMFNKKNSFYDFIDVTKALIDRKYTSQGKVFAAGGSAGGLLIGAVINLAPELYKGVAAHVPFVDVVTTMLDESIPLTTNEFDQWGNPKNKDSYEYMLSYSPYDQVKEQDYPNILVTTGLHDSQVQYFEPMKWVAKLREKKTDDNLLVFKTNMEAGHGGASGRFRRNKELALEFAFFADLAGIKE